VPLPIDWPTRYTGHAALHARAFAGLLAGGVRGAVPLALGVLDIGQAPLVRGDPPRVVSGR